MDLQKTYVSGIVAAVLMTVALGLARAQAKPTTVKGYVVDSACAFLKNLRKPADPACAVSCAKAGSPLVILAEDGTIYWPISDSMPAASENSRLMKFAGQSVRASGKVFERGGTRALVIEKIEAAPVGNESRVP